MASRLWKTANTVAVWVYRRTGGKVGGTAKGCPVLLLTVPGRSSGRPHTVPVGYVMHDGSYYLAASAGGRPKEPQWIRNLRAATGATIEVGRERRSVAVEVLRGADRDTAWNEVVVARHPFFADYETKAHRTIAVARLTPTT
ncbi:nitroreductase/quinone reductase family protein [Terrabacter aerolatus]|nr:nitroreductase/quinone reductase family protein [Terrabacter aerolatus]